MKSKGLLRTFARLGLMLLAAVAIDITVVLFPIRAYASIPNNCEVACKDVNDCGCLPAYSGGQLADCVLQRQGCSLWGTNLTGYCCGIGKWQWVRHRYYDCNADNTPDCECRFKSWEYRMDCFGDI